ncbi:actin cytoskeleton-regulatory complex protein pan1-like [Macadamia integrifolia]|uniref:actin cytoskeleton-regulatory complex protein pan1-like n=1 Tax=Macadamia integrifolia TaxID=60698 RepID=UPI001C4E8E44|nr:actin cytoskeleton-regulatory complex protein pan1-like [Macadamia integrifolia]
MKGSSTELPQKSLQIKEDDKFFSRLLSKERSMANSSFRGAAGAVPFLWESQPGTPKHTFTHTSLPPLTPPPSFHSLPKKKSVKKPSKSNLIHTILPKLYMKKSQVPPPPPSPSPSPPSSLSWSSSLSSSSSSSSTPTTPSNMNRFHRRISSSRLSFDSKGDDDQYEGFGYASSTLCFGVGRVSTASELSGCNSIMAMKNAFLSIVGHRSDRGTTTV